MKAFVVEKYGKSGLRAAQVPDPTIGPRDVLVKEGRRDRLILFPCR